MNKNPIFYEFKPQEQFAKYTFIIARNIHTSYYKGYKYCHFAFGSIIGELPFNKNINRQQIKHLPYSIFFSQIL
jgi:hypothetical protein